MRNAQLCAIGVVWLCLSTPVAASTRLIDVPFVPQSEELCGGAAVSMVMRYWGSGDVYAEDFAALVDKNAGGISVGALASAARQREWQAHVFAGTPPDVQTQLERGRPVIALIEERPGRFHYVVVVAWTSDRVVFHDPAVKPFRTLDAGAFDRRWQSTKRTTLLLLPPAGSPPVEPTHGERDNVSTMGDTAREHAGALFLQKRYDDAANLAAVAVHEDPEDLASWQLLAVSRFLEGDSRAALDAWNRRGEPRVDLARVEGLSRTRYDVVAGLLDLAPRTVLTRDRLARAERRVAALPAVQMSRIGYSPRESGSATVDVAIVERPLVPTSRAEIAASAIEAATMREARVMVASPTGNGELWTTSVRWWNDRPRVALSLALPKLARWTGLWRVDGSWERQAYVGPTASLTSEHRHAAISFGDWASGNVRWQIGASIDRWNDGVGTVTSMVGEIERRFLDDHLAVNVDTSASATFGTAGVTTRWRSSREPLSGWRSTALVSAVTGRTPLDLWPAGDTGIARPTLLRAHPLLEGGKVRITELRKVLPNASVEYRRRIADHPIVQLGWAAFIDATAVHVDAGLGMRFRIPGTPSVLRVDLARGVRDGATALSLGWQPSW